jgi:hypothetical protein
MERMDAAAFGIFASRINAETAVVRLTMAGFSSQDVSVLLSDRCESKEFASEQNTRAPEMATAAIGLGGLVGGTLGLLAGIGALAIAGVGSLIVAGPLTATLAGFGVGGAVGGLVGALVGIGLPEFEARQYECRIKDGGVMLAVRCNGGEKLSKARGVLEEAGAEDIACCEEEAMSSPEIDEVEKDRAA